MPHNVYVYVEIKITWNREKTLRKESNCLIKKNLIKYIKIDFVCLKKKKDKNLNTNEFGYVHWIS